MKTKLIVICLALCTWAAFAQHDHAAHGEDKSKEQKKAAFKDVKLGAAYESYLHLKDALVASSADDAKKEASELDKALKEVPGAAAAIEATTKLASASTLADQRKLFSALSNEMTTLVKGGKLSAGILYLEYCPMANNNQGAYWLSNDKKIKNPYFGDMMLSCGSVKEMIE